MKINLTRRTLTALMIGASVNLAIAAAPVAKTQAAEQRSYILATATTGGTYYPVGVALATLVKVKLQPKEKIAMSAISSAGSGENVKLLRENQAQFAILQGLYGRWAWTGTGKVEVEGHNILAPDVELAQARMQIGMVFQRPNPLPLSIRDNVLFGYRLHHPGRISAETPAIASSAAAVAATATRRLPTSRRV